MSTLSFLLNPVVPDTFATEPAITPILGSSDFNGDGIVDFSDIASVAIASIQGALFNRHDAIFDRNADGKVDVEDIRATIRDFGETSSLFGRQLAEIYQETKQYFSGLGVVTAALDGIGPFTQAFRGHGEHWVSVDRIVSALEKPKADLTHMDFIGLNVEPDSSEVGDSLFERSVAGVFYLVPPDNLEALYAEFVMDVLDGDNRADFDAPLYAQGDPDLFADDPIISPAHAENWHQHQDVHIYRPDALSATTVNYRQNLTDEELFNAAAAALLDEERVLWGLETPNGFAYADIAEATDLILPSFQMMHVWINSINSGEFGVFAETHPLISPDAPPLSSHTGPHHEPIV